MSAFLIITKDGEQDKISRLCNITILYLKDKLCLLNIIKAKLRQDTEQFPDPEPF